MNIAVCYCQIKYLDENRRGMGFNLSYLNSNEAQSVQLQSGFSMNKQMSIGMFYERGLSPKLNGLGVYLEGMFIRPTQTFPLGTNLSLSYAHSWFEKTESYYLTIYGNHPSQNQTISAGDIIKYRGQHYGISVAEYFLYACNEYFSIIPTIQLQHNYINISSVSFKGKSELNAWQGSVDMLFRVDDKYKIVLSPMIQLISDKSSFIFSVSFISQK